MTDGLGSQWANKSWHTKRIVLEFTGVQGIRFPLAIRWVHCCGRRSEVGAPAAARSQSERLRGEIRPLDQGGVPEQDDPDRGGRAQPGGRPVL